MLFWSNPSPILPTVFPPSPMCFIFSPTESTWFCLNGHGIESPAWACVSSQDHIPEGDSPYSARIHHLPMSRSEASRTLPCWDFGCFDLGQVLSTCWHLSSCAQQPCHARQLLCCGSLLTSASTTYPLFCACWPVVGLCIKHKNKHLQGWEGALICVIGNLGCSLLLCPFSRVRVGGSSLWLRQRGFLARSTQLMSNVSKEWASSPIREIGYLQPLFLYSPLAISCQTGW